MLEIKGAVAVITGGGSGIGESVAKYWVKQGGKVVLGMSSGRPGARCRRDQADGRRGRHPGGQRHREEDCARWPAGDRALRAINLVLPCAGIIKDGLLLSPDRETGKVTRKMSLATSVRSSTSTSSACS